MAEAEEMGGQFKKDRSPSYPFISLAKALDRAQALAANHKRLPARLVQIAESWGYGAKSSGLLQTVAALKQFGLADDIGSGDERKIVLSDLAWKILVDARPGAKEQAIREAALKPRLIAEYAEHWLPERPSDAHCLSELHLDRGFTQEAAKTFLRVFDDTVEFANLKNTDSLSVSSQDKEVKEPILGPSAFRPASFVGGGPAEPVTRNRATFPLPEGVVALELPDTLSAESYEDLKAWLDVMLRRARRSIPIAMIPESEN